MFELQGKDRTEYHACRLRAAWARQPVGRGSFLSAFHSAFGWHFWTMGLLELAKDGVVLVQAPRDGRVTAA